jgi:hypothetical protein
MKSQRALGGVRLDTRSIHILFFLAPVGTHFLQDEFTERADTAYCLYPTDGFSHFVTSMTTPIASDWSNIAGWVSHPLENAAFARRTPIPDIQERRTSTVAKSVTVFANATPSPLLATLWMCLVMYYCLTERI